MCSLNKNYIIIYIPINEFLKQNKGWQILDFARQRDSVRQRLLEFVDRDSNWEIETPKWLCQKIETAIHTEPLTKRVCETRGTQLKFCETYIFLKTICHP